MMKIEDLKRYAKSRRIRYEDVANVLRLSESMLYQYLNGERKPYSGFENNFITACQTIEEARKRNGIACPRSNCYFSNNMICRTLNEGYGDGNKKCVWFKTPEQYWAGRKKADEINERKKIVVADIDEPPKREFRNYNKIDDFVMNEYLRCRCQNKNTRHNNIPAFNKLSKFLKDRNIEKPTKKDIDEFKEDIKNRNLSKASENKYCSLLRCFFKWTEENSIYPNVFLKEIKIAK